MNYKINKGFQAQEQLLKEIVVNYETRGENFGNQDRNSLKLFDLKGMTINVKSFKVPNIFNKIAYKFFRKSKAQRSFEYANTLMELNIGTPQPIAYFEFKSGLFFKNSYYISEHLHYDLTYRELTTDFNYPNHEAILRAFTRFTYDLHEKGINFLDHSPGNTLIQTAKNNYKFYLVDLNRMRFETMSFEERIKNFAKLTIHKSMVEVMSDEYAKLIGRDYDEVFDLMWKETQAFQNRFHRKRRIKNKILFWRPKKY
ncbi:lipopolysaccharide kinase InaA family protein [Hanstruepera marina]|uniref:lipopolysaccharide kinase InaA family protein n=1 Tax=Hanstruepera marina TaxID=2873265 RepID=UPI001CA73EE3|nr:lipopolysaccharide kinase InaA family protein [Hanstruepera marina]